MQEIITIGSALTDIFITSPHFEMERHLDGVKLCQAYGEKLEADSFTVTTGGGASNAAVGFARMGFSVAVVAEMGTDFFASLILDEFHREYVSTNYLIQEKKEQTGGSVILVGKDGGRTVLVHRGASSLLDPQDIPQRALKTAEWIHLSSIAGRLETLRQIGSIVSDHGRKLSWNPGMDELELLLQGQVSLQVLPCKVLFVNRTEWEYVARLHTELRAHIPEIIITNGQGSGTLYHTEGSASDSTTEHRFSPIPSKAVDETGAGDAFAVGYVSARIHGMEPIAALEWGLRNAHSVIQHYGAKRGLLQKAVLERIK